MCAHAQRQWKRTLTCIKVSALIYVHRCKLRFFLNLKLPCISLEWRGQWGGDQCAYWGWHLAAVNCGWATSKSLVSWFFLLVLELQIRLGIGSFSRGRYLKNGGLSFHSPSDGGLDSAKEDTWPFCLSHLCGLQKYCHWPSQRTLDPSAFLVLWWPKGLLAWWDTAAGDDALPLIMLKSCPMAK